MKPKDYPRNTPFRPGVLRFRAHHRVRPPCIRLGTTSRKPWVPSSAPAHIRSGQAIFYLVKVFNHEDACERDLPTTLLAKVVCNLRNYYLQDQESTVKLIQTYFNPKDLDDQWSPEAVRLMWEYVEGFTPWLGLVDKTAIADQRRVFLENEVVDLIAWTEQGGRVSDHDLLKVFQEWNPDIQVSLNLFTRAVNAVTGLGKTPSNGKQYWVGFHIPMAGELAIREGMAA